MFSFPYCTRRTEPNLCIQTESTDVSEDSVLMFSQFKCDIVTSHNVGAPIFLHSQAEERRLTAPKMIVMMVDRSEILIVERSSQFVNIVGE